MSNAEKAPPKGLEPIPLGEAPNNSALGNFSKLDLGDKSALEAPKTSYALIPLTGNQEGDPPGSPHLPSVGEKDEKGVGTRSTGR